MSELRTYILKQNSKQGKLTHASFKIIDQNNGNY